MENKKSLSVISTQMQLINSVEAIRDLGCVMNTIIICSYSKKRDAQINSLLEKELYKNVFQKHYKVVFGSNLLLNLIKTIYFRLLVFFLTLINKYGVCIFSHYWYPNHRYVAYRTEKKNIKARLVMVDDGTGTISFYKDRVRLELEKQRTAAHLDMKTYSVAYFGSGIYTHIPQHLTLYTIYNIDTNIVDDRIKNEYKYLRNNIECIIDDNRLSDNSTIILGQSFVEIGLLSRSKYEEYLQRIIDVATDKCIFYIPHPAENIDFFSSGIKEQLNIVRIDIPVEVFCLSQPSGVGVIGFNTSAIPNIKLLDEQRRVESVLINDIDILKKSEVYRMRNVYDYFETQGIKLMKI